MTKLSFLTIPIAFLILSCAPSKEELENKASEAFDSLKVNYHEESFRLNPLRATSAGDDRYNHLLPNVLTAEYRQQQKDFYDGFNNQLASIDRSLLGEDDQLSYDLLKYECDRNLEGLQFKDYLMPISQIRSLPLSIVQLGSGTGNQPFKTVKDYDNWLSRLDGYLAWCDSAIVNMKKGIELGYVIPKPLTLKVITQLANFDHGPAEDLLYYAPIKNIPETFSQEDKDRLTKAYKDIIEERIIPTNRKLKEFIETEYLPACRETSGINAIPEGKAYYDYLVKNFTTTNKTADEIFALGLSEVDRISKEMEVVKEQVGFTGDLKAFLGSLRTDRKLRPFKSGDEIIDYYNGIHERMKPNLIKLFENAPETAFEVRQVESFRDRTTSAHYNAGSDDGTRPGVFFFPAPEPENYSIVGTENLFLHEAIPGHHYQIMLKIENKELPDFRRYLNYGAYTEGWALYTESLGKELGLYEDPYLYFGMLSSEMHRAIRLVVDAGMHSQGWTREQAIQYSKDHEAASEQSIISEIERYMGMPGQALSYKMGQLKILELRARAKQELGDQFDIRTFHTQILNSGSLPLETLEQKIIQWIEQSKNS